MRRRVRRRSCFLLQRRYRRAHSWGLARVGPTQPGKKCVLSAGEKVAWDVAVRAQIRNLLNLLIGECVVPTASAKEANNE